MICLVEEGSAEGKSVPGTPPPAATRVGLLVHEMMLTIALCAKPASVLGLQDLRRTISLLRTFVTRCSSEVPEITMISVW